MKHSTKITTILMLMFLVTQFIGLFVISVYNNQDNILPYSMEPPEEIQKAPNQAGTSILIAFVIAIALFFFLTKLKAEIFIRLWFYAVTAIAIGLALTAFLLYFKFTFYPAYIAIAIGIFLGYLKIFRKDLLVHNITELLIYPGIAAVFVPILNVFWMIILLLVISIYDIWAVWHSQFMEKMAKYQINKLQFFTGFFIPYADKKQKQKIKKIKQKYQAKGDKVLEKQFKKAKIKVNLAILGGGDVIFPIITAGVFFKVYGLLPALIIIASASIALLYLFIAAKKGKFYPAMPFLTIGMFLGMIATWTLMSIGIL
ncbi:MAG: presenilin family intramembrane aspartyl protease [archaeon]